MIFNLVRRVFHFFSFILIEKYRRVNYSRLLAKIGIREVSQCRVKVISTYDIVLLLSKFVAGNTN